MSSDTQRRAEDKAKEEAQTELKWPHAKETRTLLAKRGEKQILHQNSRERAALYILYFQASGLQNSETINFCYCMNHPVHGKLLWQPQETNSRGYLLFLLLTTSFFILPQTELVALLNDFLSVIINLRKEIFLLFNNVYLVLENYLLVITSYAASTFSQCFFIKHLRQP